MQRVHPNTETYRASIPRSRPMPASIWSASGEQEQQMVHRARDLAQAMKGHLRQVESDGRGDKLVEPRFLLEQAQRSECPTGERLRILGLMAAAVDNLFILELPAVRQAAESGDSKAQETLLGLTEPVQAIVDEAAAYIGAELFPELERLGIRLESAQHLMQEQRNWLRGYFQDRVYPLLTPLAVDPGRPFPFISTHSLNLLVHLPQNDLPQRTVARWRPQTYARIKVPRMLPRLIQLPQLVGRSIENWIWSEEILRFSAPELFQGMEVASAHVFRVLRSGSQLTSAPSLIGPALATRKLERLSQVMRLDVESSMPQPMIDWLARHLEVPRHSIFRIPGPLSLIQLVDLANIVDGISLPRRG